MQFSFNDKKFQTIHLLHVCPWNTMTDPFIVDKQQGGSIGDGRRCEIHISTRRRIRGRYSHRRTLDLHVEEESADNTETDDIFCILCGRRSTMTHLP